MRTVLICHAGDAIDEVILARWLSSFSELAAVIVLEEPRQRLFRRIRREVRRVGWLRFLDVMAFRAYWRWAEAAQFEQWVTDQVAAARSRWPELPDTVRFLRTPSPNSPEAEALIREVSPDLMLARCKSLLKPRIFQVPKAGTFVLHPGLCPEYRNAHGGFWALAQGRPDQVATTLLKIDSGIDTGPIYGYFYTTFDQVHESHLQIQQRTVLDNLDAIRERFEEIVSGAAVPIPVSGRPSTEWGQPWLSRYLAWKRTARRQRKSAHTPHSRPRVTAGSPL